MREQIIAMGLASAVALAGLLFDAPSELRDASHKTPVAVVGTSLRNQHSPGPHAIESYRSSIELNHSIMRAIDARTLHSELRIRSLTHRTNQALKSAEVQHANQEMIATDLAQFGSDQENLWCRLRTLECQMTKMEVSVSQLIESGKAFDGELEAIALGTFQQLAETIERLIALTNSQMRQLPRYSVDAQLEQLAEMYDRSTRQIDMTRDIFIALQRSSLVDTPEVVQRFKSLVASYISITQQNKKLLLESLEISKKQFIDSLQARGVDKECGEFYYNKIMILSLIEGGNKTGAFDIGRRELKEFKSALADLSFVEFKRVGAGKKAATSGVSKVVRVLKTARVMRPWLTTILEIPSDQRHQPIGETAEKYYDQCVDAAKSVNTKELQDEINRCLSIDPSQLKIDTSLLANTRPTGPTIGPDLSTEPPTFDPETQQCIAEAKQAAREAAVKATRQCCGAYNKGDIIECNRQGLVSPETNVLDNLKTLDLDSSETLGVGDFERSRGYDKRPTDDGDNNDGKCGGRQSDGPSRNSGADSGGQCKSK